MDLIYTNRMRFDQGVLFAYSFDLSFGASENNFELTLDSNEVMLNYDAFVYIEGTEYGGMIDGMKTSTNSETITYVGRTWHGIMNGKVIQPDSGEDYLVVSGDAHEIISFLLDRIGLTGGFSVAEELSGFYISGYKFKRYCKCYDGIRDMLASVGAKLKIERRNLHAVLSAVPIVDYTDSPVDGDAAILSVEHHDNKVNHLICLGKGNLAEREVIHLYSLYDGVVDFPTSSGHFEITEVYDNSNSEDLRSDGIAKLQELRSVDTSEIIIGETEGIIYDIGDIVCATEYKSGIRVVAPVTQKIVKINNGVVSTEYKTGG